ncbi:MAG: hypothetical protein AB7G88_12920, partial [Thermomicrobiales bacterium]
EEIHDGTVAGSVMRVNIGANWMIRHLTDRVVELVKEDVAYRRLTGRDGFVRIRVEPQESRSQALDRAVALAEQNDARMGLMLGKRMLPGDFDAKARARQGTDGLIVPAGVARSMPIDRYRRQQWRLARVFATSEDPELSRVYGVR